MFTPTGPWAVKEYIGVGCTTTRAKRPGQLFTTVVPRPLRWLLTRRVHAETVKFAEEDLPIWNNKCYRPQPRLAPGDEAIGRYRHWARQFYPAP